MQVDTQPLRVKTIKQLEELFEIASAIARGRIRWQRVQGKKQLISLPHRRAREGVRACPAGAITEDGKVDVQKCARVLLKCALQD